jgi:hypothetical protein
MDQTQHMDGMTAMKFSLLSSLAWMMLFFITKNTLLASHTVARDPKNPDACAIVSCEFRNDTLLFPLPPPHFPPSVRTRHFPPFPKSFINPARSFQTPFFFACLVGCKTKFVFSTKIVFSLEFTSHRINSCNPYRYFLNDQFFCFFFFTFFCCDRFPSFALQPEFARCCCAQPQPLPCYLDGSTLRLQ